MANPTTNRERLLDVLATFSEGMLVTRTPAGDLRARPMALAEINADGDVWFTTSVESGKIDEIEADDSVCVTFQAEDRYISLTGKAQIIKDREKVARLWNEAWRPWFPKGEADPSLVLLRVAAREGEYWDNHGVAGLKYLFEAARARVEGRQMETERDQHGKARL